MKEKMPPQFKIVRPHKSEIKPKHRTTQPPQSQTVEHRIFGLGQVEAVRVSGSGALVLDVAFGKVKRTLLAEGDHWLKPISPRAPQQVRRDDREEDEEIRQQVERTAMLRDEISPQKELEVAA